MILFFANNRDSKNYFQKVSAELAVESDVYVDNHCALPGVSELFSAPRDTINTAISYKDCESALLKKRPLWFIEKIILVLKGRWFYAKDMGLLKRRQPQMVIVWNGLMFRRSMFVAAAKTLGIKTVFMENGLLPETTVCDSSGINAVNSMPRSAKFYHELPAVQEDEVVNLVTREAKKPKKTSGKQLPDQFFFIPFQVDTDSQIIIFSPWIKTMLQFFEVILSVHKNTNIKLVFKEHPSSKIDYAYLHDQLPEHIGMFANEYSTQELIEKSKAVITINSTVGIESLLFAKKVIVLGEAFYNIPGLVLNASSAGELQTMMNDIDDFEPDEILRKNFLAYLRKDYLIEGSWRKASSEHCQAVANRLMGFLNG